MKKTTLIPLAFAILLFANVTVATTDACRPRAGAYSPQQTVFTTTVDTYLSYFEGNYFPGTPVPLRNNRFYRLLDRFSQFDLTIPGLGDCTFKSTEDAMIRSVSNVGRTYGDVLVESTSGITLTAKSFGKVFPQMVEGLPAIGFNGRVRTVGKGNVVKVVGNYLGYFLPDNPNMLSGYLHMEITLKIS